MARVQGAEPIYEAANAFRERCLITQSSLLWPDSRAWTPENIDALLEAYIVRADHGDRSFLDKWKDQLADEPDDVVRIAADALSVYLLYPHPRSIGPSAKQAALDEVRRWRPSALQLHPAEASLLKNSFATGLGGVGARYNTNRPNEIAFLLKFSQEIIQSGIDPFDLKSCRELADRIQESGQAHTVFRHAILHVLFPDDFERIISEEHKRRIIDVFQAEAEGETDLDLALLNIRHALEDLSDQPNFDFYREDIRAIWDPPRDKDIEVVRQFLEKALPDPATRRIALERLVDSIRVAHNTYPTTWTVSFRPNQDLIRLNVGLIEALTIGTSEMMLMIDSDETTGETASSLTSTRRITRVADWTSKTIPSAQPWNIEYDQLEAGIRLLTPAHEALLKRAADARPTSIYRKSHWPSIVEYFRADIDPALPQPGEPSPNVRYWKISPGNRGSRWQEFKNSSEIAVGWKGSPDLEALRPRSADELAVLLDQAPAMRERNYMLSHASKQLWMFLSEMSPGDRICTYSDNRILGLGTITGGYFFDKVKPDYRHRRSVTWTDFAPVPSDSLPPSLREKVQKNTTILELSQDEFAEIEAALTKTRTTWLVQANPKIWTLTDDLAHRKLGDEDTWSVNRYLDEMHAGDRLLLWQRGPDAGLFAIGELTSEPFERPTADFWPDKDARSDIEHAISYRYTHILANPLLRSTLLRHPILKDMQVIRAPQGTIFKVSAEKWDAINGILDGTPPPPPRIRDVAVKAFMDVVEIHELEELLLEKKQIVLEGPPGSGKTYLADLLARYLTGNPLAGQYDEHLEIVQFHQSYGYEDFIQGIRPDTDTQGTLRYRVKPGIFMQLCERAAANPNQKFVLIIDEINRGNISRIFGELMLLLEYRDKSVHLPFGSGEGASAADRLSIPGNLYLIATMNSTDRSLALIDYALRRRFYFYNLLPVKDGAAPVFRLWLDQQEIDADIKRHRLRLFIALNTEIQKHLSSDFQIGHSYFMTDTIGTRKGLDRIWERAILPLLGQYFHNVRSPDETLKTFAIDRLEAPDVQSTVSEFQSPEK